MKFRVALTCMLAVMLMALSNVGNKPAQLAGNGVSTKSTSTVEWGRATPTIEYGCASSANIGSVAAPSSIPVQDIVRANPINIGTRTPRDSPTIQVVMIVETNRS